MLSALEILSFLLPCRGKFFVELKITLENHIRVSFYDGTVYVKVYIRNVIKPVSFNSKNHDDAELWS